MTLDEYGIKEAEKMVNRKVVEQKIRDSKRFFRSAIYREIVGNEDDEVEGYTEDDLSS